VAQALKNAEPATKARLTPAVPDAR
jgi:hypothetical protein